MEPNCTPYLKSRCVDPGAKEDQAAHCHHREADQEPFLTASLNPLSQAGMNSRGIGSVRGVVDELVLLDGVFRQRLDVAGDVRELAREPPG